MLKNNSGDLVVSVLLNYNQNDYTIKCIESLLRSEHENLKILLVDNGSINENFVQLSKKLPKDQKIILKRIAINIGYSQGTNFGLSEAYKLNPDYFLILNNDTIIDNEAISHLINTCKKNNNKSLVTGKVYHYDKPDTIQFIGFKYVNKRLLSFKRIGFDELDVGQYNEEKELDMIDDIMVLQPVSLYESIGGYSPFLWINGVNVERGLRSIEQGYKLIYTPEAKIWHKGSVSFGGREMNPKLAFWNVQSRLINRYLHLNKANFIQVYLKISLEILRTFLKSIYLYIFKNQNINKYALAKFKALLYFHRWLIKKNINTGYNPY